MEFLFRRRDGDDKANATSLMDDAADGGSPRDVPLLNLNKYRTLTIMVTARWGAVISAQWSPFQMDSINSMDKSDAHN